MGGIRQETAAVGVCDCEEQQGVGDMGGRDESEGRLQLSYSAMSTLMFCGHVLGCWIWDQCRMRHGIARRTREERHH